MNGIFHLVNGPINGSVGQLVARWLQDALSRRAVDRSVNGLVGTDEWNGPANLRPAAIEERP